MNHSKELWTARWGDLRASFLTRLTFRGKGMMMKRAYAALALLSVMALLPQIAEAGRYGGSGSYVNTPFGTIPMGMMNQAGGNPFMASEMQQQQMMYQQQMMMMKQQQQYMQQMQKMQKAGKNPNGSTTGSSATGTSGSGANPFASTTSSSKKKKKVTPTKSSSTPKKKTGTGSTTTTDSADGKISGLEGGKPEN